LLSEVESIRSAAATAVLDSSGIIAISLRNA
jgi:hypothetical protein